MFSIIIPLYNRETFITETLNSVIQQTFSDWECIVVDDGSTDNSIQIVKKFEAKEPRIKLVQRDREPKNANTCRNIGIEVSTGDWLIFLDSDDLLLHNCLELRKKLVLENGRTNLLVTGTGTMATRSIGKYKTYGSLHHSESNFLDLFLSLHSPWFMTSGTWKKDFLLEIGQFDENLLRLQDPDIHIRALLNDKIQLNYSYHKIDHIYRIHGQRNFSSTNMIQKRINGYITFFSKFKSYPGINHTILEEGVNKTIVEFLYSNKKSNFKFDQLCQAYFDKLEKQKFISSRKHKLIIGVNNALKHSPNFRGLGRLLYFITKTLPKSKYA